MSLLHCEALVLLFWLTPKEKEPEDEQGYYVSSVHIKKYSATPLDISHIKNEVPNMLIVITALHNIMKFMYYCNS